MAADRAAQPSEVFIDIRVGRSSRGTGWPAAVLKVRMAYLGIRGAHQKAKAAALSLRQQAGPWACSWLKSSDSQGEHSIETYQPCGFVERSRGGFPLNWVCAVFGGSPGGAFYRGNGSLAAPPRRETGRPRVESWDRESV